jgi:hypothetical protein
MSAAQVALRNRVASIDQHTAGGGKICDLTHELRQPLGAIEAIAYYLEMTLPPDMIEARGLLSRIQNLLEQTDCILECAEQNVMPVH